MLYTLYLQSSNFCLIATVAEKSWSTSTRYSDSTSFIRPFRCFQCDFCRRASFGLRSITSITRPCVWWFINMRLSSQVCMNCLSARSLKCSDSDVGLASLPTCLGEKAHLNYNYEYLIKHGPRGGCSFMLNVWQNLVIIVSCCVAIKFQES